MTTQWASFSRQKSMRCASRSGWFACFPHFFAGPFPGPSNSATGSWWSSRAEAGLDQVADLEPAPAQQPDHIAVADMELNRVAARPLETVHAEIRPLQRAGGWLVVLAGPGQDDLD